MFGWSKAIKEAVTTKDVMENLVAVMTRALEREWELRIENSELKKQLAVGCGPLTEDSGGAPSDNSGWKVVTGLWTGEGGAASTTEGTELHGKVDGHTAVEWKETAEALQLVANRLEKEKAELVAELAATERTTAELTDDEVERLCGVYCEGRMGADSYYSPFGKQGDDIQQVIRAGIRAVVRELPRLPYPSPEVGRLTEDRDLAQEQVRVLMQSLKVAGGARNAMEKQLDALRSLVPVAEDGDLYSGVKALQQVAAENSERAEEALAFSGVAERLLDELRGLLRCSAGENILEVARERMKEIENSEKENQKDAVVVEQWWSLRRILECPEGEVLIAYAEGLMASHKAMEIENGEWRRERKKLEDEKALQGENISAFQVEQEALKSEKVALMERVEGLQAELEDLTSRKVGGVVASGEVSDLLDALGVEQGMTLRAAVNFRMGDWKRQQERLARYMERVESLKSELEMTRTQLDESQAANAAIPAVHQQVVSDLKAEHALNQDAMRQNHENELAGIRQMLEQERGLVQVAACGPWMSPETVAPTEGMVALLEMREGLGEDTEPVTPWRLEFGFYDAVRLCWWTSIGQQDRKLVQRMAVVRKGNLRAEIQEMLQVGDGEGGIKNSELRSEKEEGAEGLGEGVGNGEGGIKNSELRSEKEEGAEGLGEEVAV